jgi:Transcriptional regulator
MPLISSAAILLDAVAKAGSIRGAAAKQNISASALNRQILNLEEEYGTKLFERLPRGVRLTSAGEALLADVRRWLRDQERTRRHLSEMRGDIRGHAAIGLMETMSEHVVDGLMTFMRERRSQISLDVQVGGTETLVNSLLQGQLDLVICYAAPSLPEITALKVIQPTPGIIVSRDHPLASRRSIRLTECAEYSFVLPDASLSLRKTVDKTLERLKFTPRHIVTTNSIRVMKMLVLDHEQIAILGLADVLLDTNCDPRLIHIPFADKVHPGSKLSLIAARHAGMSPVKALIAERLSQMLDQIPGRPAPARGHGPRHRPRPAGLPFR